MKNLFIIALIGLATITSQAQVGAAAQEKIDCKSPGNEYEADVCVSQKLEKKEAALKRLLKKITLQQSKESKINPEASAEILARLKKSQVAWVTFKNVNCELEAIDMLGGSGESRETNACHLSMTTLRIKNLKQIFNIE